MNFSQAAAIKAALTQTLTLWQGPPGTGKTSTLLHFLRLATLVLPGGEGSQIIASAASNVAVDGLVIGLLKHGIRVVRMGQPAKVSLDCASLGLAILGLTSKKIASQTSACLDLASCCIATLESASLQCDSSHRLTLAGSEISDAASLLLVPCATFGCMWQCHQNTKAKICAHRCSVCIEVVCWC